MTDALYSVIPVVLFLGYFALRRRYRVGLLDHPVDFLRRRMTRGLRVSTGAREVRRGEEVEALVAISSSRGLGNLQVGVVCTESYDYMSMSTDRTACPRLLVRPPRPSLTRRGSPSTIARVYKTCACRFPRTRRSRTRATAFHSGGRSWHADASGVDLTRGRRKRSPFSLEPSPSAPTRRHQYTPGDTVKGTILVLEGGGSRSLEALLEYKEETADYLEVAISIPSGPLHEGDLTTGTSFEFELTLPPEALPNCKSKHGELYWEVDAKSNEAGRDTHDRRQLEVQLTPTDQSSNE
jgi:hypothetical protein